MRSAIYHGTYPYPPVSTVTHPLSFQERQNHPLEDDADARWRVGPGHEHVKLEDLILVSIHHVSMGSWQPHLRLRRPFSS